MGFKNRSVSSITSQAVFIFHTVWFLQGLDLQDQKRVRGWGEARRKGSEGEDKETVLAGQGNGPAAPTTPPPLTPDKETWHRIGGGLRHPLAPFVQQVQAISDRMTPRLILPACRGATGELGSPDRHTPAVGVMGDEESTRHFCPTEWQN